MEQSQIRTLIGKIVRSKLGEPVNLFAKTAGEMSIIQDTTRPDMIAIMARVDQSPDPVTLDPAGRWTGMKVQMLFLKISFVDSDLIWVPKKYDEIELPNRLPGVRLVISGEPQFDGLGRTVVYVQP